MKRLNLLPKFILVTVILSIAIVSVTSSGLYLHYRGTLTEVAAMHGDTSPEIARTVDEVLARYDRRNLLVALVLGLASVVIAGGVFALIASRQVRSIRDLAENASRIATGDFSGELSANSNDELGELASAFTHMRDQLQETTVSRDFLTRVLGSMSDAIILTTPDGRINWVNEAAEFLFGDTEEYLVGRQLSDFVTPEQRRRFMAEAVQGLVRETVFVSAGGEEIPVSFTCAAFPASGPIPEGRIFTARNITERKKAEQRIRYLARIDALTKVPNRMQFQHLLQRSIARARRSRRGLAFMYLDIDRFKDINDTYGHTMGDLCLEALANRLRNLLPDKTIIGRLAGDEFGLILDNLSIDEAGPGRIRGIAQRVLNEISQVLLAQGQQIYMTASIGIASYPRDGNNVIDLIRNADAALYQAKKTGGNAYAVYTADMNAQAVDRLMLKSRLRRSYEQNELLLHYQPRIDITTGDVVGAEALVRWELSERGLVLPSEFIPLAEETNLILEVGEWVLNQVCADVREWQQQLDLPGRISVNVSVKQLRVPNFIKRVRSIIKRHDIDPSSLEFEITETTLMDDAKRSVQVLRELHDMGVHIAIDDFGTGYSSLSALQQFPISTLKIDQSFVRDAASDPDDATIVATIIDMGHSLKLHVVAEGVESEEQLDFLRGRSCDSVQGLLFGNPMTADDLVALLRAQDGGTNSYPALFG